MRTWTSASSESLLRSCGDSCFWRLEWGMAKLALVYGLRLVPADELSDVKDAEIVLKNGKSVHVTMHLIEGGEAEVKKQLLQSLDAFFEFYPEI